MTVLIATLEGIGADRRVTGGTGHRFGPRIKVVRGDGLVAAFCGDGGACEKAARSVRDGETDPHALGALCDGLLVNTGIWELNGKLAVRAPRRVKYVAHGSGWAEAAAFLAGCGEHDPAAVRAAIRYVAKMRWDCGDGFDWVPV